MKIECIRTDFELETLNVKMQQTEQQLEQLVRQFSELQQQLWCNDETTTTTAKECACCQSTQAHQFIGQTV